MQPDVIDVLIKILSERLKKHKLSVLKDALLLECIEINSKDYSILHIYVFENSVAYDMPISNEDYRVSDL